MVHFVLNTLRQEPIAFDADFLGAWIAAVEFTAAYQNGRRPQGWIGTAVAAKVSA